MIHHQFTHTPADWYRLVGFSSAVRQWRKARYQFGKTCSPHLRSPAYILISMHRKMRRLVQKLFFELTCALFLGTLLHAVPLAVHKVSTPPALSPLTMTVGGRMLTTPSPTTNSFGDTDYTYQWPGSYFRAAFEGTRVFFRVVKGDEILHVVVDGRQTGALVKPEAGAYEIEGLHKGGSTQ